MRPSSARIASSVLSRLGETAIDRNASFTTSEVDTRLPLEAAKEYIASIFSMSVL